MDYRIPIHNDGFHSKTTGASVITSYLANFVKENGYKFSHKDNNKLNDIYKYYVDHYDYLVLCGEHDPSKYLDRVVKNPRLKLVRYQGNQLNDRLKKFFNDLNLTELVEGDDYYAIIYDNEILTCSNSPVSYVLDSHDMELNKDGIYFDGEQLTTGDEFAFVVFNSDYTVKLVKKITFSNGLLWDSDYDFNYNHK